MPPEASNPAGIGLLLLLALGVVLLVLSRNLQRQSGLPDGDVVYTDTRTWQRLPQPLFSQPHQLAGKPDYVVAVNGQYIPIEVKSSAAPPTGPYDSHVYQLAAYCLLITETYRVRPAFGLIRYADRVFEVAYTPALEKELLGLLAAMRRDASAADVARSHNEAGRCQRCGVAHACDQRLI